MLSQHVGSVQKLTEKTSECFCPNVSVFEKNEHVIAAQNILC